MAELLLANEWTIPGSLEQYLQDRLPGEYILVAAPVVYGQALDVVVVGPRSLTVLYEKDWSGTVQPANRGGWTVELEEGSGLEQVDPRAETGAADKALRSFLREEFPSLQVGIRHLLVLTHPSARVDTSEAQGDLDRGSPTNGEQTNPGTLTRKPPGLFGSKGRGSENKGQQPVLLRQEEVADFVMSSPAPIQDTELDDEVRESVAKALSECRMTASQRTSDPFVFRSGGLFGSGKRVWTLGAAIRHMDRRPEDGIYHLRNDSLASWLEEQGALDMAVLARDVLRRGEVDPRVSLESFLVESGLVRRPRLRVRPKRVDLGYVMSGDSCSCQLRVQKGRGRGYLFGRLISSVPWLRIEPQAFSGGPVEVGVRVDTESLLISSTPWRGEVQIESSASVDPIDVPVRVRVRSMPSVAERHVLRPLVGFLTAGILGAVVGLSLGTWVFQPTSSYPGQIWPAIPWAASWALIVGLVWALMGALRGWRQPLVWPTGYALWRWLLRTVIWALCMTVLAAAGHWCWRLFAPAASGPGTPPVTAVILCAIGVAIFPSVLGEIRAGRRAEGSPFCSARQFLLRPSLVTGGAVALAAVLVAGAHWLGPVWQQVDTEQSVSAVEEWSGQGWTWMELKVNGMVDDAYEWYYGYPAPEPANPADSSPTPGAESQSEMP